MIDDLFSIRGRTAVVTGGSRGIGRIIAPLEEYPEAGWDKVMDTNVKGVFLLTQALLPDLRATATPDSPGRVINISSTDGARVPQIESYAYSTSKAAVNMLTRHLARRLAGDSICVNAVGEGAPPG